MNECVVLNYSYYIVTISRNKHIGYNQLRERDREERECALEVNDERGGAKYGRIEGDVFHLSRIADAIGGRRAAGAPLPQIIPPEFARRQAPLHTGGFGPLGDHRTRCQRRRRPFRHHLRLLQLPQASIPGNYHYFYFLFFLLPPFLLIRACFCIFKDVELLY